MEKPTRLTFSDEASFTLARGDVIVFPVIVAIGFLLALNLTDATLIDLTLPFVALSSLWFFWVGILVIVAWGHRISERSAIYSMFKGEIWEYWQFGAAEWQALVEGECSLISPKDEGLKAYVGAVYSSIFGVIIAVIMVTVGMFVIEDPDIKIAFWIVAAVVFLLLLGIGLFQPVIAHLKAYRYQRKALRVAEPHVWFASDGIYHESLGYTSLKELEKVTDQTRSRKAIQFTLTVSTDIYSSSVAYPFPVPTDCEEQAGRLVRRYRQERIMKCIS